MCCVFFGKDMVSGDPVANDTKDNGTMYDSISGIKLGINKLKTRRIRS